MAISTAIQTDVSFKDVKRRAYTSTNAKFFEENIPRIRVTPSDSVITEAIPYPPPPATTSVVEVIDIRATLDRGVPGNKVWVLKATWQGTWDSGSGNKGDILTRLIDPALGGPLYVAEVYAGTSGSNARIPELDASDWSLDYDAGVLVFNSSNRSETGNSADDSIRVKCYRYIGETLATSAPSNAGHTMARTALVGVVDGTNKDFLLPVDCNTDLLFMPLYNGQQVFPGADWTQDATNPLLLHFVASPDPGDVMHVVYYPAA
jgi:hypothetical protein